MSDKLSEDLFKPVEIDTLTEEKLKTLDKMFPDIERQLASLRKLGINTRELEDKLKWGKEVSETLQRDFKKN